MTKKSAAISKLTIILTELSRSHTVVALPIVYEYLVRFTVRFYYSTMPLLAAKLCGRRDAFEKGLLEMSVLSSLRRDDILISGPSSKFKLSHQRANRK